MREVRGRHPRPIRDGVAYTFSLGHCGLHSPVDVDGSYWDELDGVATNGARIDLDTDGEMINATIGRHRRRSATRCDSGPRPDRWCASSDTTGTSSSPPACDEGRTMVSRTIRVRTGTVSALADLTPACRAFLA